MIHIFFNIVYPPYAHLKKGLEGNLLFLPQVLDLTLAHPSPLLMSALG